MEVNLLRQQNQMLSQQLQLLKIQQQQYLQRHSQMLANKQGL